MKRQIILSIILTLGVLLSLANLALTTQGQQQLQPQQPQQSRIPVADTGIVTLSPNQMLRLTVTGDWNGDGDISAADLIFRRLEYAQVSSNDGVGKTAFTSQTMSDPITLAPGENASFDIPNTAFGVRGVVLSNRPDVRVTAQIINRTTGEVQAFSGFDGTSHTFLNQMAQTAQSEVTVVRRINQARLTAAMIQTIRSSPRLNAAVAIQGNTIIPLLGNSLWLLSNGGYALVAGSTVEPLASEVWSKWMGSGYIYWAACYCPRINPNTDDGCEFNGSASPANCNGPTCCQFEDGLINLFGESEIFHQAT